MVAPELDAEISAALRMSCSIENSGQCTAMRHLVTDACGDKELRNLFEACEETENATESLRKGAFDGLFKGWKESFRVEKGYERAGEQPVAYRISKGGLETKRSV